MLYWLFIGVDRCSIKVLKEETHYCVPFGLSNGGMGISQRCVILRLKSRTVFPPGDERESSGSVTAVFSGVIRLYGRMVVDRTPSAVLLKTPIYFTRLLNYSISESQKWLIQTPFQSF